MNYINRVLLVGRLTRDPELSHTSGGTAVTKFALAVNGREKDNSSGEWTDRADFFDVTVFGNQAEAVAEYLAKGRLCAVDGRLKQERWKTRDTQENRSRVVVIADNVQFVDGGGGGDSAPDDAPMFR